MKPPARAASTFRRRIVIGIALASAALLVALLILPLRTTMIRLAIVGSGAFAWLAVLVLTWRSIVLRAIAVFATLVIAGVVLFPGKHDLDAAELRARYVAQLLRFEGVRYVYGGENLRGIDCSGLVRAAMVEALARDGARHVNAHTVRESLRLWWHDTNAIDLGNGRCPFTRPIGSAEYRTLAADVALLPGDLAVTESGSHVLAALGDGRWIEAEPNVGGTHVFDLQGRFSYLANERVRFVRWIWLE